MVEKLGKELKIETWVCFDQLRRKLWEDIQKLEPFGEGNRQPVLATKRVVVTAKKVIGSGSQHLKLRLQEEKTGTVMEAVGFNLAAKLESVEIDSVIDVAYALMLNDWRGQQKFELRIKDIRKSD